MIENVAADPVGRVRSDRLHHVGGAFLRACVKCIFEYRPLHARMARCENAFCFFSKTYLQTDFFVVQCYMHLPVAQLDSASDSDSEGRRFESFRVGQKFDKLRLVEFFIHCESNGISSRVSVHFITEGVYHQP